MSATSEGNPRLECLETGERYLIHTGTGNNRLVECPGCGRRHRI